MGRVSRSAIGRSGGCLPIPDILWCFTGLAMSINGSITNSVSYPMSSKNPCISVCKFTDETCIACGRTKPECKAWKKMDKDERRDVNAQAVQRLKDMKGTAKRKKKKA